MTANERVSISRALLKIEANAVIYIHTYIHAYTHTHTHPYIHTHIHTYLHPKMSNEAGFGHRHFRLVTYAT